MSKLIRQLSCKLSVFRLLPMYADPFIGYTEGLVLLAYACVIYIPRFSFNRVIHSRRSHLTPVGRLNIG